MRRWCWHAPSDWQDAGEIEISETTDLMSRNMVVKKGYRTVQVRHCRKCKLRERRTV